ncbi:MAG: MATE family efflux transporter [Lachnospiraceae bacterium]|nr:MATE family efflux transporter [Lachnospiraceae bacterium]
MENSKNRMGYLPIPKLIVNVSVPLMVSMLVQSLYNVVDSMFVSRISEHAVTAVSLAYSAQMLMLAVAVGTGVGVNSLLSRSLGKRDFDKVNSVATNGLFLAVFWTVICMIIGTFGAGNFIKSFTDDPEISALGTHYLSICMIGCIGIFVATTGERLLQSTGNTTLSMISQLCGAVTNIILDPIFIFGFNMGISGAAYATIIGQMVAAAVSMTFNAIKNKEIHFSIRGFKPDYQTIAGIYKVGIPTFVMQTMGSLMMIFINKILFMESSTAVAFYGIYYKLYTFLYMPVSGLSQGLIPIVGFNFGAKKPDRIREAFKLTLIVSMIIMTVGAIAYFILPSQLLGMYNASSEMLTFGVPAMRIMVCTYPIAAITICIGFAGSGLGNGVIAMIGTLLRQLALLIPTCYLLYHYLGFGYLWYAVWLSEICAAAFSIISIHFEFRKKLSKI